ncbi:MAG: outer membrane beta-barrel protein [Magnetospirillum sp.]|nr:outer membrane beta-barrel protein [Magnetospirillum sp.]
MSYLTRKTLLASTVALATLCTVGAGLSPALADDAAPAADPSAIKFSALVDTGITAADNSANVNYGHLFTDKNDQWLLNQAMLTAEKDLDPKATGYDWGFKLQGFYGSDARYTHFIGMFDHNTSNRNQFDITEANVQAHLPVLTDGGIDTKVGAYSTPLGEEVIQANNNYLYSHSYIFNFALPLKHTGVLTTTHVTPVLDVWLGADSGINTTLGDRGTVNNGISGIAGVGLNLMGGNLTVLGLSHFGPADPNLSSGPLGYPNADHVGRYINDIVTTYKLSDAWTLINELNYTREDLTTTAQPHGANAYAVAQYAVYAVNPSLSLVGRGEIFADPNHFFVSGFQGNNDFVDYERGNYTAQTVLGPTQGTTYSEITFGANIKPAGLPAMLDGAMIRPEVRYDTTLDGHKVYDNLTTSNQFTASLDLVIPVSF